MPIPSDPRAFRRSLNDRLKNAARHRGQPVPQLQRQFYIQRFLARVFAQPSAGWVLKGGTSLLVRDPDARHTRDIDLLHTAAASLDDALARLHALGTENRPALDPFRFDLHSVSRFSGLTTGATIKVTVYLGAERVGDFPIDLSTARSITGEVEYVTPVAIVDMDQLAPLPPCALYPLSQQIADKLCAMYERHGADRAQASTRYHDLADLVLIIDSWPFAADATRAALAHEAARRSISLPTKISSPAAHWSSGYARVARDMDALPAHARNLYGALDLVDSCLGPLVRDEHDRFNTWQPDSRAWSIDT